MFDDCAQALSRDTRTMAGRHMEIGNRLLHKVNLVQDMPRVPSISCSDLWCYKPFQLETIGRRLMHLWQKKVPAWKGVADYHQNAVFQCLSRLFSACQILKKAEGSFWPDFVRLELRMWARCVIRAQ